MTKRAATSCPFRFASLDATRRASADAFRRVAGAGRNRHPLIEKRVKPRPSGRGRKARTPKASLTTRQC
ncbi:hypothetical protein FCJ61_17285 [Burkholderia metallica]|nr:hypothetical protein [Burkholderia metallica]